MKHRINGCPVNLRGLSDDQLDRLIEANHEKLSNLRSECSTLLEERSLRQVGDRGSFVLERTT
jgi:hypothetical protein